MYCRFISSCSSSAGWGRQAPCGRKIGQPQSLSATLHVCAGCWCQWTLWELHCVLTYLHLAIGPLFFRWLSAYHEEIKLFLPRVANDIDQLSNWRHMQYFLSLPDQSSKTRLRGLWIEFNPTQKAMNLSRQMELHLPVNIGHNSTPKDAINVFENY